MWGPRVVEELPRMPSGQEIRQSVCVGGGGGGGDSEGVAGRLEYSV